MIQLNIKGLVGAVERLVAPFEKLASYYGVGAVGIANYPHLPTTVRAVLAAAGALVIHGDRTKATPAA